MSKYVIESNAQIRKNGNMVPIICLAFLFPVICAIIRYHFVSVTNGYALCLLCYLCTIMTVVQYIGKDFIYDNNFIFLILFLAFYGLILVTTNDYTLIYNLIFMLPILVFSHFSIDIKDKKFIKMLLIISIALFAITMVMTINTLAQHPGAARVLASRQFTEYGYDLYVRSGTGGFDFIYSVTVMIPVGLFVSIHITKRKIRIIAICFTIGAIITVLLSGYATAILLATLGIALVVCTINKWMLGTVIIISPLIIGLYLSHRMDIANYISDISRQFSSRAVSQHLVEIADIIAQKSDVDNLERADHYKKSLESFLAHPLLGNYIFAGPSSVSGHSTILDLLGGTGLVCTVPFLGYLASWFFKVLHRLKTIGSKFSWGISSVVFFLLLCLNPVFASPLILLAYFSIISIIQIYADSIMPYSEKPKRIKAGSKYLK